MKCKWLQAVCEKCHLIDPAINSLKRDLIFKIRASQKVRRVRVFSLLRPKRSPIFISLTVDNHVVVQSVRMVGRPECVSGQFLICTGKAASVSQVGFARELSFVEMVVVSGVNRRASA